MPLQVEISLVVDCSYCAHKYNNLANALTLLEDVSADSVGVAIAAPPTDGEANAELVRYLSKVLELKKSEITLDKVLHT